MNLAEILLVAVALAMDATIYSFSYGLILKQRRFVNALRLAIIVGEFQAGMPLVGYLCGHKLKTYADTIAPLLVLLIFCILGAYIIYGAWTNDGDTPDAPSSGTGALGFMALLLVGIATSMDALAVGVGMALGNIGGADCTPCILLVKVCIIGFITFLCSMAAFHSAKALHHLPTRSLETAAGLLLIGLGLHAVI